VCTDPCGAGHIHVRKAKKMTEGEGPGVGDNQEDVEYKGRVGHRHSRGALRACAGPPCLSQKLALLEERAAASKQ
jgi:hypothetical protein